MNNIIAEYERLWKLRPLRLRIRDKVWWRLSYLRAFFTGGPCVAEVLLLRTLAPLDGSRLADIENQGRTVAAVTWTLEADDD